MVEADGPFPQPQSAAAGEMAVWMGPTSWPRAMRASRVMKTAKPTPSPAESVGVWLAPPRLRFWAESAEQPTRAAEPAMASRAKAERARRRVVVMIETP